MRLIYTTEDIITGVVQAQLLSGNVIDLDEEILLP